MERQASRRDLLFTSLMAALPLGVASAGASPLNPEQTIIKPPDALQWKAEGPFPPESVESCPLIGRTTEAGLYYTLIRWHPGYMSAPHSTRPADIAWCCQEPGGATAARISILLLACPFKPAATYAASP